MDPQTLGTLAATVGFPISLVITIIVGGVRIARWLAPFVEGWFQRHFLLMESLQQKLEDLPTLVQAGSCRLPPDQITILNQRIVTVQSSVDAHRGALDSFATKTEQDIHKLDARVMTLEEHERRPK